MNFRNIVLCTGLLALSWQAQAITTYPAGTIFSGGLTFLKSDATLRSLDDATAYCSGSSAAGLTGWRLPTELELTNLYYDKSQLISLYGWSSTWMWTTTPYMSWRKVVRLSDGVTSYSYDPQAVTCVRATEAMPTGTINNAGLNFLKPDTTTRTWANSDALCAASTAGGVTGWRVPSELELSNLYYDKGAAAISVAGWPSGWIWASTPYSSGHNVVRMSDGLPSWDSSGSQLVSCVREENALTVPLVLNAGLQWMKPPGDTKTYANADSFCSSSTHANMSGWRLPTQLELSNLYFDKGASAMADAGWPNSWIWTSTVYSSGHKVTRMSNGDSSWDSSGSQLYTCVRDRAVPPAPTTINSGSLTWSKPTSVPSPLQNGISFCGNTVINGSSGWRLPTASELLALYADKGSSFMAQAGWPSTWIWSSTPQSSGYEVVRMSDGTTSWGDDADTSRWYVSCVQDTATLNASAITSGGNVWAKPAALAHPWTNTAGYCEAAVNGQNGWRLPAKAELTALYSDKGATYLAAHGWSTSWNWSYSPYNTTGYKVVRLSDGVPSYGDFLDSSRYGASCVRDSSGLPAGSLVSGGLTWVRGPAIKRPWNNAENACSNATIAGLTGWRLPTLSEFSAMYSAQSANLADAGWAADWYWTGTASYRVIRLSDGLAGTGDGQDLTRYYLACVR